MPKPHSIQPRNNRILVEFLAEGQSALVLPEGSTRLAADSTKIRILAVCPTLEHIYEPGDYVIVHPSVNIFPVDADGYLGLIDASSVLAVCHY